MALGTYSPGGGAGSRRARRAELAQTPATGTVDLICFSHLRWDYVYQRPQHLMSRAAREFRVFFVEEARPHAGPPRVDITRVSGNVRVVVPYLEPGLEGEARHEARRKLLADLFARYGIREYVLWYMTPAPIAFTRHLTPLLTVYDCVDELTAFKGAPRWLAAQEAELLRRADLVFTGGRSLYEAKRDLHPHVHLFPSSIDREHFAQARGWQPEPADQAAIPRPRLGFFGVIDDRLDLGLLDGVAAARPGWHIVLLGPAAKINADRLPRRANIHYLGKKPYAELPVYLAGWDVALLPFAINGRTRYVSPTRTPEYLAGGVPVVSTPLADVVHPYGDLGLVHIAGTPGDFVAAVEKALASDDGRQDWLRRVDALLAQSSWDQTWRGMAALVEGEVNVRRAPGMAQARIAQAHFGELLFDELDM